MRKATRKMTKDPVVIKILRILQQQEKTGKDMEQALGLANGAVSKWKYSGIKSYRKHIHEIAKYLDVTVEELESEEVVREDVQLTATEKRLLAIYRKLNFHEQQYCEQTLMYLSKIADFENLYVKNYNENEKEITKTSGEMSEEDENPLS